jgi:hypothetical protein
MAGEIEAARLGPTGDGSDGRHSGRILTFPKKGEHVGRCSAEIRRGGMIGLGCCWLSGQYGNSAGT